MSEHIEGNNGKNLASLVSVKGGAKREGPDGKLRLSVANTTRRASFDGFLNTFLGRDASQKKEAKGPGSSSSASSSGLRPSERESLENSMNKTVDGGESGDSPVDGDVAAAAEEAALLIWNLLYGYGEGAALPGSVPDSLRQLADMLGGRVVSTSRPGLGLDAVQDAIHTANASAEMNSAAILASVDELLEGMPRHVLDEALGRMAGQMGLPAASGFEGVLAMLRGRIVGVNAASGKELLGTLSASAVSGFPAENAAGAGEPGTIETLLQEFLAEKAETTEGGGQGEPAAEIADEFAAWLQKTGKSGSVKELSAEDGTLADALAKLASGAGEKAPGGAEGKPPPFADLLRARDAASQSGANGQRDAAAQTLSADASADAPAGGGASPAQANAPLSGGSPAGQAAQAPSVGAMLERMENIERLAEAMRAASRGGVNNITLQLAPAELGKVLLRVQSKNGVVSASLKVERAEAAEQLGGNLQQLRESLKALGIELGAVEIRHQPPPAGSDLLADLADPGGHDRGGGGREADPSARDRREAAPAEPSPPVAGDGGAGALNFFA